MKQTQIIGASKLNTWSGDPGERIKNFTNRKFGALAFDESLEELLA